MCDKRILKMWVKMEDWGDYLERNGGLTNLTSQEGFKFLEREYFQVVRERIIYCEQLLKLHDDAFLNYVLAELYDRCNLDESKAALYKKPTLYYCRRALEIDPHMKLAQELLNRTEEWVALLESE